MYFSGGIAENHDGQQLWRSDGTAKGTYMVKDFAGAPGIPTVADLTEAGGAIYFVAGEDRTRRCLWRTDGTTAGTVKLMELPGGDLAPEQLTQVGDLLFFTAYLGAAVGRELCRTDGTPAGSGLVKDIYPGAPDSENVNLCAVGNVLYFRANDGIRGSELWRSDGTLVGTELVRDIASGSNSSAPEQLTEAGGYLFFSADDGVTGRELWSTNTATLATSLVEDFNVGEVSSLPRDMHFVSGALLYFVGDAIEGLQLRKLTGGAELSISLSPAAGGHTSGQGIYEPGSTATIRAEAMQGYAFLRWEGAGVADPNASTTTVDMSVAREITAVYGPGDSQPYVVEHPETHALEPGTTAHLRVEVEGTLPITYQWMRDNVPVPGATGPELVVPSTEVMDSYAAFSCEVSNGLGADVSRAVFVEGSTSIGETLDFTDVSWKLIGSNWSWQEGRGYFTTSAWMIYGGSGLTRNALETEIEGPGYLRFSYLHLFEPATEALQVMIDGVPVLNTRIGDHYWSNYQVEIPAGLHTVTFEAYTDGTMVLDRLKFLQVGTFEEWLETQLTSGELAQVGTDAFGGDFDGDGLSNGVEYYFSTDPSEANPAPYQVSLVEGPHGKQLRLNLTVHGEVPTGVHLVVLRSFDLNSWQVLARRNAWGEWYLQDPDWELPEAEQHNYQILHEGDGDISYEVTLGALPEGSDGQYIRLAIDPVGPEVD